MRLKHSIAVVFWLSSYSSHATDDGIQHLMEAAAACSDAALRLRAAASCDAPEMLASLALGDCRARWDAVAQKAIGSVPQASGSAMKAYRRSLKAYTDALAFEYIQAAELKAIDLRNDAGTCASDQP